MPDNEDTLLKANEAAERKIKEHRNQCSQTNDGRFERIESDVMEIKSMLQRLIDKEEGRGSRITELQMDIHKMGLELSAFEKWKATMEEDKKNWLKNNLGLLSLILGLILSVFTLLKYIKLN